MSLRNFVFMHQKVSLDLVRIKIKSSCHHPHIYYLRNLSLDPSFILLYGSLTPRG